MSRYHSVSIFDFWSDQGREAVDTGSVERVCLLTDGWLAIVIISVAGFWSPRLGRLRDHLDHLQLEGRSP